METADARHRRRVAALQATLPRHDLDALLVTHLPSIRYMTGFTGTAARLLVARSGCVLIVDFRYHRQASLEAPHCHLVHAHGAGFEEASLEAVLEADAKRIGFESGFLSYWDHGRLEVLLPKRRLLVPSGGQVEAMRRVKDDYEIACLRRAGLLTTEAMAEVIAELRPGWTEAAIAAGLDFRFRSRSCEAPAFDTLVAAGPRSAFVHARASDRAIAYGDVLLIDAGAAWRGYRADMSRTMSIGRPDRRFAETHGAVREALECVIAAIRPGAVTGALDRLARRTLAEHGLGDAFLHGLGHGVGLEIHEEPWLAPGEEDPLAAGMVVAIEPGVYLDGWGGIRLEETVLVTGDGCEVLTRGANAPWVEGVLSLG